MTTTKDSLQLAPNAGGAVEESTVVPRRTSLRIANAALLGLPKINGYDVARQLRGEGFASSLMVAVSGYARDSDVEQSRSAGFDLHLAKPVDIDHLLEVLASS